MAEIRQSGRLLVSFRLHYGVSVHPTALFFFFKYLKNNVKNNVCIQFCLFGTRVALIIHWKDV